MTPTDFRRIALALPDTEESSHMGVADFRTGGRVFATLAAEAQGFGNLMLTTAVQAEFIADAPDLFLPVHGGWGRMGITHIRLAAVDEMTLAGALRTAYNLRVDKNAASKRKPSKPQMKTLLRSLTILAAMALLAPMLPAQQTLATLVDRSRVLLLFAPTALDPRYGQQFDLLTHHENDLRSRDLVVIPVIQLPGPPNRSTVLRTLQPPLIHDDEQITIRRRFHVASADFVAILLGKDGTEKLRSATPIAVARLNRTIDSMPGRRAEMRNPQH